MVSLQNVLRISTAGELVEIVKNIKFDQKNDNISQIIDHIKYRCESGIAILNWRFTWNYAYSSFK